VVLGANPLLALPEPHRLREAFGKLDALAIIDVIGTESTECATHVLPALGQLERADLSVPVLPALYAQYTDAVVASTADRRAAWWYAATLGRHLVLTSSPRPSTPTSRRITTRSVPWSRVAHACRSTSSRPPRWA